MASVFTHGEEQKTSMRTNFLTVVLQIVLFFKSRIVTYRDCATKRQSRQLGKANLFRAFDIMTILPRLTKAQKTENFLENLKISLANPANAV
jgi:hypothetical protein